MAYNKKEWMVKPGRTTEEIRARITELPIRGLAITKDDPEFSTMERRRSSKPSISNIPAEKTLDG
jgi:hypothetical protein